MSAFDSAPCDEKVWELLLNESNSKKMQSLNWPSRKRRGGSQAREGVRRLSRARDHETGDYSRAARGGRLRVRTVCWGWRWGRAHRSAPDQHTGTCARRRGSPALWVSTEVPHPLCTETCRPHKHSINLFINSLGLLQSFNS